MSIIFRNTPKFLTFNILFIITNQNHTKFYLKESLIFRRFLSLIDTKWCTKEIMLKNKVIFPFFVIDR